VAYQGIFLQAQEPSWLSLWPTLVVAILLNALGLRLFRKHQVEMVDEL